MCYLFIVCISVWNLWPRDSPGPNSPSIVREHYGKLHPDQARAHYWDYLARHYDSTYAMVKQKGRRLFCTIPLLGAEVATLIFWLFQLALD